MNSTPDVLYADLNAHLNAGDDVLDTAPDKTIELSADVGYVIEPENGPLKWKEWRALLRHPQPGCAIVLKVERELLYTPASGESFTTTAEFDISLDSIEEAEFVGHLILATVKKLRRTADRYQVPLITQWPDQAGHPAG